MDKLSKEEAYELYRQDPAKFFNDRIHSQFDNETTLIHPAWPKYWSTYHYNLVENGIIEILRKAELAEKEAISVLDIGIGTGHWLEFYSNNFELNGIAGVDFSERVVQRNQEKFSGNDKVTITQWDITNKNIPVTGSFEVINAIGVIFHIVDDARWADAIENLKSLLKPGGVLIIGGDFSNETKERGVMRRNRSIQMWDELSQKLGLRRLELLRYDWWAGADQDQLTNNLLGLIKD